MVETSAAGRLVTRDDRSLRVRPDEGMKRGTLWDTVEVEAAEDIEEVDSEKGAMTCESWV